MINTTISEAIEAAMRETTFTEAAYALAVEENFNEAMDNIMPLVRDSVGKLGVKSRGKI